MLARLFTIAARLGKKTIFLVMKMIINGLVGQRICATVFLAPHVGYAKGGKFRELLYGFLKKWLEIWVFDSVLPADLLNNKF